MTLCLHRCTKLTNNWTNAEDVVTACGKLDADGACSKSRNGWAKKFPNDIFCLGSLCKRERSKSLHSFETFESVGS